MQVEKPAVAAVVQCQLTPYLKKVAVIMTPLLPIAMKNGRKTAELNIYSFPRDDASTSAGKTIITMINQLRVSQCYTTSRAHGFPTPEAYHGLMCLGTNSSIAGSSQQLPLPPERPREGKFSQENSVGWPDIELAKFRVLESSGMATDKLVEIVAHAFARFVAWSLLIEPVAKTTQAYELKLASVNRANRPESMEQVGPAFSPRCFHSFLLGNPNDEGTYLTNALEFHSKWAIIKYHLCGLESIYTRMTERPGSTAYPHKAVTASLQQRVEIVASARL